MPDGLLNIEIFYTIFALNFCLNTNCIIQTFPFTRSGCVESINNFFAIVPGCKDHARNYQQKNRTISIKKRKEKENINMRLTRRRWLGRRSYGEEAGRVYYVIIYKIYIYIRYGTEIPKVRVCVRGTRSVLYVLYSFVSSVITRDRTLLAHD